MSEFIISGMKLNPFLYVLVVILLIISVLIFQKPTNTREIGINKVENCLICHDSVPAPDNNHSKEALGCSSCHLGNPYATKEKEAHRGMIKNPANLPYATITCGKCHKDQVERVKHSIMATNAGLINTLRYQWGELPRPEDTIDIYNLKSLPISLAVSHYRKFCATCHIWKRLNDLRGEIGTRGGGCVDCHLIKERGHNALTIQIPSKNCTKCHNRSARIGLSYYGIYESEGYGTPFENGVPNNDTLSSGRFYRHLIPDIHSEYGLECIDCHTSTGLMGTGKEYPHVEDQVDITCEDCHDPVFVTVTSDSDSAIILARLNGKISVRIGDSVAITRKRKTELYNVKKENGKVFLFRKLHGDSILIKMLSKAPYHTLKGHEDLSCQACHTSWIPQCYGCHDVYREKLKQLDKLSYKRTPGRWMERRSYLRYEHPVLVHSPDGKIFPAAPGCQVYLTVLNGERVDSTAHHFALAFFDPHTTRKASRSCEDCHLNPKTIGLGVGNLSIRGESLIFTSIYDSESSGLKISLESFISTSGNPIQRGSRPDVKPLSLEEIKKILTVGFCIQCHSSYSDPIYENFKESFKKFNSGVCPPSPIHRHKSLQN